MIFACFDTANCDAVETQSNEPDPMISQESDWIAAYESNGPNGAREVPMCRASWSQIAMAGLMILGTGALAWTAKKDTRPCNTNG